jgi:hypothetical protein
MNNSCISVSELATGGSVRVPATAEEHCRKRFNEKFSKMARATGRIHDFMVFSFVDGDPWFFVATSAEIVMDSKAETEEYCVSELSHVQRVKPFRFADVEVCGPQLVYVFSAWERRPDTNIHQLMKLAKTLTKEFKALPGGNTKLRQRYTEMVRNASSNMVALLKELD